MFTRRLVERALALITVASVVGACGSAAATSSSIASASGRTGTTVPTTPRPVPTATGPIVHTIDGVPMSTDCLVSGVPAQCGFAHVYEDRAAKNGRILDLLVAIFPATDPDPKPDPIFFLAGGPGGNAVGSFNYALTTFPDLHRDRDFVLVDQRGTGQYGTKRLPNAPDLSKEKDPLVKLKAWLAATVKTLDVDPTKYTSWVAADDLDQVRESLGYGQINLFGGSYGATMAQVYLAAHSEHVRTVTLTGVSLLDVHLFEHAAVGAQEALDRVLARCDADAACHAAFPAIAADFAAAFKKVKAGPVTTGVTNPQTNAPFVFDEYSFGSTVEAVTVSLDSAAALPRAIHHAAAGDWDVLAGIAVGLIQPPDADPTNLVMSVTIRCAENWARWDPAATTKESAGSYEAAQIIRAASTYEAVCSAWPKASVPALDSQAVHSDKPVLLLVGGADPADPPENAADAPVELPNSVTAIFPAGGHCVETYGCAPSLMTQFIEAGTAKGLDVSCAAKAPVPPFDVSD